MSPTTSGRSAPPHSSDFGDSERRDPASRIPELTSLVGPLLRLSAKRKAVPLLYLELSAPQLLHPKTPLPSPAAWKSTVARQMRAALGSVLRRGDLVASGPAAGWFVALLIGRAFSIFKRSAALDADLGLAAQRLRTAVQDALPAPAAAASAAAGRSSRVLVRAGWTVLEPVPAEAPLEALKQALRGAAVVARTEERRAIVLAAISHELRTPLTSIIGYSERLATGSRLAGDRRVRYAKIIEQEARRLHRLVEGLIDLGSWNAGALPLRLRRVRFGRLAAAAKRAVLPRLTDRRLQWEVIGRSELIVDPDRFAQVLINLADNAVRHAPPGGKIAFSIGRSRRRIVVADDGPPLSDAVRGRLGAPFAAGTNGGAAGLGLAIARMLVEAHGGRLLAGPRRRPKTCGLLPKIIIDLPARCFGRGT